MIWKEKLIEEFYEVIIGLSGGADSVCLAQLLSDHCRENEIELSAVHVEHGIRGEESREDAAFVEAFCRDLGIPCTVVHVDAPAYAVEKKISLEEAARKLRYEAFRSEWEKKENAAIALAHHADDQAETILFRLARGTGAVGLAGMFPITELDGMPVVRPLLSCRRSQIEEELRSRGISWREDRTNADESYSRNRIRHRVIPELCRVNPRAVEHICSLADEIRGSQEEWAEQTGRVAGAIFSGRDVMRLERNRLRWMEDDVRAAVLREWLKRAGIGLKNISRTHIRIMDSLLTADTGKRADLPGFSVEADYDTLKLIPAGQAEETGIIEPVTIEKPLPGESVSVSCGGLNLLIEAKERPADQDYPKKTYAKWFDYDKIKRITVRNRMEKDVIEAAPGAVKKLTRYFIDEKVPRAGRDEAILLADGKDVIWIIGYRDSTAYRVTEETKTILDIKVRRS